MTRSAWKTIARPTASWGVVAALVLGSLLAACGPPTYIVQRSAPLSADEVRPPPRGQARLVASHDGGLLTTQKIEFSCLDGKSTFNILTGYSRELVVPPGRHYLGIKAYIKGYEGGQLLWLDAEPNHFYEYRSQAVMEAPSIFGAYNGVGRFSGVLVDRATNKPVGGVTGGQPPTPNDPPKCGP